MKMESEEEIDIVNDCDVPLKFKNDASDPQFSPLLNHLRNQKTSSTKFLPNYPKDKSFIKNRKPWTKAEKEMFFTGQSLYGNDWKQIAELIGTRSPAQVHSFAYYRSKSSKTKVATSNLSRPIQEAIVKLQPVEDDEDLELCVDDEDSSQPLPDPISTCQKDFNSSLPEQFTNLQYVKIRSKVKAVISENKYFGPDELQAALRAEFSPSQLSDKDVNQLIPLLLQDLSRKQGTSFSENSHTRPKGKKIIIISNGPSQAPLKPEKNCGYTLEHGDDGSVVRETKVLESRVIAPSPFKLVTCLTYPGQAPLKVKMRLGAALMITIHTYSMRTEVIGLLGGHAPSYKGSQQISASVCGAYPCRALSTGYQCEMDPVSQCEVSEQIHSEGMQVVGWYHSHPTFDSSPSHRDLDTQSSFQDLFSSQAKSVFVAIISSRTGAGLCTFHVVPNSAGEPVPYELPLSLVPEPVGDHTTLLSEISSLCTRLKTDADRLYLPPCLLDSPSSSSHNCIQKLLDILRTLIKEGGEDPDEYLPLLQPFLLKCRTCSP